MSVNAQVKLWGTRIGAVTWDEDRELGVYEYDPSFIGSEIEPAPLKMPLRKGTYEFPSLSRETFHGLPGMLADSLPDNFGNAMIDEWLVRQGRTPESFNPVERLCYVGTRGMGALEFDPAIKGGPSEDGGIEVYQLVELVNEILDKRARMGGRLTGNDDHEVIEEILRVGTSAGGARPKAILAWNPETNDFRSGQIDGDDGYEHWLLKFDGITSSSVKELGVSHGYGRIEYAYYLMAKEAGIRMSESRLHNEGGRSHFMTKRFDRTDSGKKLHMQSLCAMAHYDYNQPNKYSYEQALQIIKFLKLSVEEAEQQFARAVFNVMACNNDDHVKNVAFLMGRDGKWKLSPAFDVTYSRNPQGYWTNQHQMSINGKRKDFVREDLLELARAADIKSTRSKALISEVKKAIMLWREYAEEAGVSEEAVEEIRKNHITDV